MNVKVLFVIPPYFNIDDFINKHRANVLPAFTIPYGVLSLEAYLKAKCDTSVETSILDLNVPLKAILAESPTDDVLALLAGEVRERVNTFQPDIVGISALFNSSFRYVEDIAKTIKQVNPAVPVIAGGGLPSAAYEKMLNFCPSIDAICKGEGEIPLAQTIGLRLLKLNDHGSLGMGLA
jgi:radical SAM superfamily enzyme YgiQ (UPF0313 family)